ncbi:hypothetical protein [Dendronalium sp. ChiSLP03b]|uniref:hypothetical protein n=1 Tax=Dendronalium sp. ChiSLP03b TaxID=3075381 RepID=UPI002AD57BF5|nr:hypothetical protein [Dendronalium sp. ChiSLP03b]MDZ8209316.1 hypothetical protein [Dendronalium sp. ChiSLP03b]
MVSIPLCDRAFFKTVSVNLTFGIGLMSWEADPTEFQTTWLPCLEQYAHKLVIIAGLEE